ncbi:hypothetical protein COT60_00645 [Candidatus Pacearchaeota archaeon CG09_land_8_20_14_0_10_30_9]|nr:hypothetical protein [Candidatus Pacearchaeota archaeon]OIO40886.1 MAG: hypothetical protein AUJ61_00715 [Candidatus Pacearchaeota archaeon CG1_02_30_18]PIN71459.1 MAG: hypothetical protein COV77_01865 [Candidatus Pacearchaeota archaeon CG11_big_fil_rev_8_21_14_0_20_30_13]PIO01414.1 MAG: hypothetical protein COT60_00645 [Candidatus Pacearchaeota archaeon CG09_land_8_20_14_0_10_30_9]PIZ81769.1 MAG: hypothetical protein COX98_02560 [Candidatus Pacearchaeota archaeon CG_4_10_14_0_2_um_filter_30
MTIWKKKEKYVDLSDKMRKQQERIENFKLNMEEEPISKPSTQENSGGFFSFFGGSGSASSAGTSEKSPTENPEERRKKLTKIISDITTKMEDLENQIYHLKQRMEVLERKQKIGY